MSSTETSVDPPALDQEFFRDPYIRYAWMRGEAPVQRAFTVDGVPVYLITKYGEARAALADPRFGKDYQRSMDLFTEKQPKGGPPQPGLEVVAHMLNTDPPDHTRLRKLVVKAFTARRVEDLRPRVEEITADLLDGMAGKSEVDLLDVFAFPLPITVISDLLGVAEQRRDDFRTWTQTMLGGGAPELRRQAGYEMTVYLKELIAEKREHPADDLMTGLIEASEEEDRLDETELVAMVFLLLIAGHETTVNLIGNCVLSLLRDPVQWAAVRDDPELVAGAIEEALRFESPVHLATTRHTTEAVRVGDVEIPEGELVFIALGSANRDGERFEDADRFDISRPATSHLAFGHGIHFCLGAPLARMEGQIALRQLLRRYPEMALARPDEELRWRFSTLMRGLEDLPVYPGA